MDISDAFPLSLLLVPCDGLWNIAIGQSLKLIIVVGSKSLPSSVMLYVHFKNILSKVIGKL